MVARERERERERGGERERGREGGRERERERENDCASRVHAMHCSGITDGFQSAL